MQWKRKRLTKAQKFAIAQKARAMLMRRKEHPFRVLFLFLAIAAMVSVLIAAKYIEYEMVFADDFSFFSSSPTPLEIEVREMTVGYPIEAMAPFIGRQNPTVAAFLVSIAKKESNWGKRAPVLNGRDCYNYWGYRGSSEEMGSGGHTCFRTRKEAVRVVAKRIETLVKEYQRDTPEEMIVWKCGYDCSGHSEQSVRKWIADVSLYFKKFRSVGETVF